MLKKVLFVALILALLLLATLINRNPYQVNALQVKSEQPSTLRVVDGSSQIINGKVILQPTFNPQQQ